MYAEQRFEPEPREIASVRHMVRSVVGESVAAQDLVLIVSELATNAVLHAGTPFRVSVSVDSVVRLEVADESHEMPTKAVGGITNHGLDIVDLLAARWGIDTNPVGKTIWVEIDRPQLEKPVGRLPDVWRSGNRE